MCICLYYSSFRFCSYFDSCFASSCSFSFFFSHSINVKICWFLCFIGFKGIRNVICFFFLLQTLCAIFMRLVVKYVSCIYILVWNDKRKDIMLSACMIVGFVFVFSFNFGSLLRFSFPSRFCFINTCIWRI